jgi:hypothetical protein
MSSTEPCPLAAEEIARDARWLAQALDPSAGAVRLIAMDRDSYRAASFLDDRILQQPVDTQVVAWPLIEEAMAGDLRQDARWIFHIGHVGSTLASRLLGELAGVLGVREPRLLRDLAMSPPKVRARYVPAAARLMSRTFAEGECACVKATSWASEIAPDLVPRGERALLMFATPRNYVASILAGENSLKELHALAPVRDQRLQRRRLSFPAARSNSDLAAMAWACEITSLEAAADAMSDRHISWADFDRFLGNVEGELGRIAADLGFAAPAEQLRSIAQGPLMRRYSKALEYDYSPELRRELITDAERRHAKELGEALAMLRSVAERSPLLARALSRAED